MLSLQLFAQLARAAVGLFAVGDEAQRVHLIAVQEHIDLHEIGRDVLRELIVERGVALRLGLEGIEEIVDDLVERHFVMHFHEPLVEILHVFINAAALLTERHDVADELVRRDDRYLDERLERLGDGSRVGVVVWVIDEYRSAVGLFDLVNDRGERRDEIEVELALQPLLNDLHVQHAEEAAAEAEAERDGAFPARRRGRRR